MKLAIQRYRYLASSSAPHKEKEFHVIDCEHIAQAREIFRFFTNDEQARDRYCNTDGIIIGLDGTVIASIYKVFPTFGRDSIKVDYKNEI